MIYLSYSERIISPAFAKLTGLFYRKTQNAKSVPVVRYFIIDSTAISILRFINELQRGLSLFYQT